MEEIRASAFYLLLRAHDHVWNDHTFSLKARIEICDRLRQDWGFVRETVPAVVIDRKRLIEVNGEKNERTEHNFVLPERGETQ